MTYTKRKLTDPMLQRLSAIVKGRKHKHGNSLYALEARGLIQHDLFAPPGFKFSATPEGRRALADARREGW